MVWSEIRTVHEKNSNQTIKHLLLIENISQTRLTGHDSSKTKYLYNSSKFILKKIKIDNDYLDYWR